MGDQLLPNTPSKKASVSLSYAGQQGVDANVTVRLVDGYQWAAGVFQGYVPSSEFVNVSAGYRVNNYFRSTPRRRTCSTRSGSSSTAER